jgi:predicted amidophosphoribosyltransferase
MPDLRCLIIDQNNIIPYKTNSSLAILSQLLNDAFVNITLVKNMTFCPKCGEQLSENAYFCSKCGARTNIGKAANVASPSGDWKDAFAELGEELNKAFAVASKEIEKAFTTAKEEIKKATSPEPAVCPNCGEKNSANAQFCTKCGAKIQK